MKKIYSMILILILLAASISACATSGGQSSSTAPAPPPSSSVDTSSPEATSPSSEAASSSEAAPSYEKPKFMSIGTAAAGGAYYPIGIAMADLVTNNLDIAATAQVTGGSIENNTLIQDKTVDFAITMSNTAFEALSGAGAYQAPCDNLSAVLSNLSAGIFHVVVKANSGINTMADLKGKRVVMGPAGGGAIPVAMSIWEEYGFTLDDVQATYISYSDGISSLKDGNCDAVVVQSAAPAAAIKEMEASGTPFKLVSIEKEMMDKIVAKYPYYFPRTIATDVYGTTEPAEVLYAATMIVCRKDLPEGLVYDVTKLIFENVEAIRQSNPSAKELDISTASDCSIPLHPGAERYYKEVGVLK